MPQNIATVGPHRCGTDSPLLFIAGPCVLETEAAALSIAERLAEIASQLNIQLVFKASFDKANRTSIESYRGPGLEVGLAILKKVKELGGTARHCPDLRRFMSAYTDF